MSYKDDRDKAAEKYSDILNVQPGEPSERFQNIEYRAFKAGWDRCDAEKNKELGELVEMLKNFECCCGGVGCDQDKKIKETLAKHGWSEK